MQSAFLILSILAFVANGHVSSSKKRVCVIGAGPSGLVSARFLSSYPEDFEFIVFEKNSDVGGLWIYTDSTTVDEHGLPVHSSMYKYLRTNVPKEIISYPDFERIQGENSSFVKHQTMLEYFRNYTDHYDLRQYIRFNFNVEKVTPLPKQRWLVQFRDLNNNNLQETSCDAVIVANGHTTKGNIPTIPGMETFPGRVIHSHLYRKPDDFTNQTVVVLGASLSGIDIGIEISWFAKKVYLSSRHDKIQAGFPPNLEQVVGVVAADGNELILSDNSRVKADALVFCTGYLYEFPFLDSKSGIVVEGGKYIKSLYKHLINVKYPTMAIMAVTEFRLLNSYAQAQYFLAVLRDQIKLPSRQDMLKDSQLPEGKSISKAHQLNSDELFSYNRELTKAAHAKLLPYYYRNGYYAYIENVYADPLHYREKNLYIYEDGRVEFV